MDYTYVPPPVPTLERWRKLTWAHPGQSLLRMLEYERLASVRLSGRVLDMGGGRNADYLPLLPEGVNLESVNIDPRIEPTHLVQPGQPLPLADDSFDAAICFNTLEHIYDAMAVLKELHRVVRPGGEVHVIVPFMFRIHGHPDDYFRATPNWWRESFGRTGFSALLLSPLVWGRRSTAAVVPGLYGPSPRFRMHLAMLLDVLTAKLLLRGTTISGRRGESICGTSPGWYMIGTK
ncbi:class I SAM-dependent methyltransferase [Rhodovulum strictum]|uniref:Methyltransferase domain-containing protein n=1 Tax=Rhodovulum strictum TaxID=58314 RepID=A0A844B4H6_9RHOB|nr:class I SAM-dependent methyltransferase [Rhodovulum strictum]MRH20610.1 methyltransferase domain-containing protein [Rhodovulum strictum]